jgi:hypothetical protein
MGGTKKILEYLNLRRLTRDTMRASKRDQPKAYKKLMRASQCLSRLIHNNTPINHIFLVHPLHNGEIQGLWQVPELVILEHSLNWEHVEELITQHCTKQQQKEMFDDPPSDRLYRLRQLYPDVLPATKFVSPHTALYSCLYEDAKNSTTWILTVGELKRLIGPYIQVSVRMRGSLQQQITKRTERVQKILNRAKQLCKLMSDSHPPTSTEASPSKQLEQRKVVKKARTTVARDLHNSESEHEVTNDLSVESEHEEMKVTSPVIDWNSVMNAQNLLRQIGIVTNC